MTIIKRVAQALIDNGNGPLADELATYHAGLTTLVNRLGELHYQKDQVVRQFINLMQHNCEHEIWHHTEHESEVACMACGHAVNSDRTVLWGKRVLEKHYDFRYRPYYAGGMRFRLNREMKEHLGKALQVPRITTELTTTTKAVAP